MVVPHKVSDCGGKAIQPVVFGWSGGGYVGVLCVSVGLNRSVRAIGRLCGSEVLQVDRNGLQHVECEFVVVYDGLDAEYHQAVGGRGLESSKCGRLLQVLA